MKEFNDKYCFVGLLCLFGATAETVPIFKPNTEKVSLSLVPRCLWRYTIEKEAWLASDPTESLYLFEPIEPIIYPSDVIPTESALPFFWNPIVYHSSKRFSTSNQAGCPASVDFFDHHRPPDRPNWDFFERGQRSFRSLPSVIRKMQTAIDDQHAKVIKLCFQSIKIHERNRRSRSLNNLPKLGAQFTPGVAGAAQSARRCHGVPSSH